ncbi:pimeloyl-ACP methyl ester carboxylesterase [Streptomyces sp. LBL]|nr:pimeloyl-ACP methyl ester carboxylesterase [Streptomyces sp. LBL]
MIEVLERAKQNGPTILVAHSRGGITTTAVANARPELIDRIAYVSAWCPIDLDVSDYYAQPEMADVDAGSVRSQSARRVRSTPAPAPASTRTRYTQTVLQTGMPSMVGGSLRAVRSGVLRCVLRCVLRYLFMIPLAHAIAVLTAGRRPDTEAVSTIFPGRAQRRRRPTAMAVAVGGKHALGAHEVAHRHVLLHSYSAGSQA